MYWLSASGTEWKIGIMEYWNDGPVRTWTDGGQGAAIRDRGTRLRMELPPSQRRSGETSRVGKPAFLRLPLGRLVPYHKNARAQWDLAAELGADCAGA